jgi:hypothetical protein
MSKKIMLLALSVAATAMFALPATASASLESVSLHMSPTPAQLHIAGGTATLRSGGGTVTCSKVSGTATPSAGGTTGTMTLTFGPHCTGPTGETCGNHPGAASGTIVTTPLTYHLVTLKGKSPGVLIKPVSGAFAHFDCNVFGFPVQNTVEGNGVLGTITAPSCGGEATSTATLSFKATGTAQQHTEIEGTTPGPYTLTKGGEAASQEAHATLTATDAAGAAVKTTLVCT